MTNWIRRLKGGIGIGLTWAVGCMPIGALMGMGLWVIGAEPLGLVQLVGPSVVLFGALGFIGGFIFSTVLQLGERRRGFHELTLPRFALWGGLAGLLVPAIVGILGGLIGVTVFIGGPGLQVGDVVVACVASLLSAGSAAGSLAIARKAEDAPRLEP